MDNQFQIRLADESDARAIGEIYNHYVRESTCTFDLQPQSTEDRLQWLKGHGARHPVIVSCIENRIVGWASLSQWHVRPAYSHSAEISVYIHHDWHRKGIGRALLVELIRRAKAIGLHVLVGGVCTEQTASMKLQESLGFVEVARYHEIGRKFNRWLDVAYFQLTLDG